MKRIGGIWAQVVHWKNLVSAYRCAAKGKKNRRDVARFELDLEKELLEIQQELMSYKYSPAGYRQFHIYDRKPRCISAAPFRDRVVHHALMNIVEPLVDRTFIDDCYASRKGKGVHAAVDRYQGYAKRFHYAMKLDIVSYFPSIKHDILKRKLRCRIKDSNVLWLFDQIIDSTQSDSPRPRPGYGLPIGNLTSQFFGNFYLNDFDHWVKEQLRVSGYIRYVDDMIFLHDDKSALRQIARETEKYLRNEAMSVHQRKRIIAPASAGLDVLGYRVWPNRRRLRAENGHRFARRFKTWQKKYHAREYTLDDIKPRLMSWIGHARHGDTKGLRRAIISSKVFAKGTSP